MEMTELNLSSKEQNKLVWNHYNLPNIPIYQTKLPQDIMDRLWGYVSKARVKYNDNLAGNIDSSYLLDDEDNFFFDKVVGPIAYMYANHTHSVTWVPRYNLLNTKSLMMNRFWVNFQKKHEFNPIHTHSGIVSFVIWMKIPTNSEDQHALPISANSNSPTASNFEFSYSDMLGGHQQYTIDLSEKDEGTMLVFPAKLCHQVYPFYECDEDRVSISGNICWNSYDLDYEEEK